MSICNIFYMILYFYVSFDILILKGFKMSYSLNKELLSYAMKMGCKTAADFAMFLKARESILSL